MLFESRSQSREQELAQRLKDYLIRAGIPSASGAKTAQWATQIKKLTTAHGHETVQLVIDWYGPRALDPYLPMVRSAKSLCEKFNRLLEVSGIDLLGKKPSQAVVQLIRRSPLRFPVTSNQPNEAVWLQDALEGLERDLGRLRPRVRAYLGPPSAVLRRWRELKHAYACSLGSVGSFNDLRYNIGDDTSFRIMIARSK